MDTKPAPEIHENTIPSPITSDKYLESQINIGDYDYYIGFLMSSDSPNKPARSYLPCRVAPHLEKLEGGWSNLDFSILNNDGSLIKSKDKNSDGIEVNLGMPIIPVEIVESETGIWVGFHSPELLIKHTRGQSRLLYTKPEYIRIKDGQTCALISKRFLQPSDPLSKVYVPEGAREVSPKDNESWLSLTANDVRLVYYNFNEHNSKSGIVGTSYNAEGINKNPTLKCSEGYYYFILGENKRQSEAVTSGEIYGEYKSEQQIESEKQVVSSNSIAELKQNAFDNLLTYLGKRNTPAADMLRDEHFILAGLKVNTQTANPNNQKALFAIRANYIDALPDTSFSNILAGTEYENGKNYAFSVNIKELPKICADLAKKFKNVKGKLETSKLKITDVNGLDYNINVQIEQIENFAKEIDLFLARQSFPATTDTSQISSLASSGTKTEFDHILQFGITDNDKKGCSVRETISYVMFSPDPKSLEGEESNLSLFDFDPFITNNEIDGSTGVNRSGVNLKVALPYIREVFAGAYGSRTLHIILSHSSITKTLNDGGSDMSSYDWAEFLQKYCVPPLKIYPSKDPQKFDDPEEIDCDELIDQLNKTGPNSGRQEKLLQEKLYNNPKCKEKYFEQFKTPTYAGDPSLQKKSLEKTSEELGEMAGTFDAKSPDAAKKGLTMLYRGFFHSLDPMALLSLIFACLQKKLGLDLTLQAICESAILKLVESIGPHAVGGILVANALLHPNRQSSQRILAILGNPDSPYAHPDALKVDNKSEAIDTENSQRLVLDARFNDCPIATALIVGEININPKAIEVIRNFEKANIEINLLNKAIEDKGPISIPQAHGEVPPISNQNSFNPRQYRSDEIEFEKTRLIELGYSIAEANALLVQNNYLIPDPNQYGPYLSGDSFAGPISAVDYKSLLKTAKSVAEYSAAEDSRKALQDAKEWLDYMKNNVINIEEICELIVGDLLDGLEDLFKNPGALLGGLGTWWEDFIETLVRAFPLKIPSIRFPEKLNTDSHMGDYGPKLLMMLLSMIGIILGQIAHLLIKDALERCLEENTDQGPGPNPALTKRPASETIPSLRRENLPQIPGISDADVVAWLQDLIDSLKNRQLCNLLRGIASKSTLYDCLIITQDRWPQIYAAGIDTINEIRIIFEDLGTSLGDDLDVCDLLTASSPVIIDVCDAIYNRDARCEELKMSGLTPEECETQIERELDDLRNKVIAMAGLGMFGMDPLDNVMPPACGEGGFFEIPPGVKDSMSRVTDNILSTVKGSLIQDLASLEFFAVPPRAIAVMTDPQQMKDSMQIFSQITNNPYYKEAFAYIGDPYSYSFTSGFHQSWRGKIYPITYNKYSHYGGLITRGDNEVVSTTNIPSWLEKALEQKILIEENDNGQIWSWPDTGPMEIEIPNSKNRFIFSGEELPQTSKNVNDANQFELLETLETAPQWNMYWPLSEKDIKEDLTKWESFVKNSRFFEPIHYGNIIRAISENSTTDVRSSSAATLQKVVSRRPGYVTAISKVVNEAGESLPVQQVLTGENTILTHESAVNINNKISEYWQNDSKPRFLKDLMIPKRDLFFLNQGNDLGPVPRAETRVVFPLHMKLRDIDDNPQNWIGMLQSYTGLRHSKSDNAALAVGGTPYDAFRYEFSQTANYELTDAAYPVLKNDAGEIRFSDFIGATKEEIDDLLHDSVMASALSISPGYAKLYEDWLQLYERALVNDDEDSDDFGETSEAEGELSLIVDDNNPFKGNQWIVKTFMNLTLAEALGLEDSRVIGMFPSFGPVVGAGGVILKRGTWRGRVIRISKFSAFNPESIPDEYEGSTQWVMSGDTYKGPLQETTTLGEWATTEATKKVTQDTTGQWGAQYIVFRQHFPDPESPLSYEPEKMIEYFSNDKDKVNEELYTALTDGSTFQKSIGFDYKYNSNPVSKDINKQSDHWNPDIIKIDTSFTELTAQSVAGFSGVDLTNKIASIATSMENTTDQFASLTSELEFHNKRESLIYQNAILPLYNNFSINSEEFKDAFKFVKGKITGAYDYPDIIAGENYIGKEKYNFNFGKKVDDDVKELVDNLYNSFSGERFIDKAMNAYQSWSSAPRVHPLNLKGQIFGMLLTKRFFEAFEQYKPDSYTIPNNCKARMRLSFTRHSFTAMQATHVHQAFSKLKDSRLHERGMMKSLWKKILKHPMNSNAPVDPRCATVLDQFAAFDRDDLENAETDFFNLDDVKQRIMSFYEKSLCHDVYEKNDPDDNAARVALLQGCVILLVKVYALEVCLASIIAWDSYDLSDIIKDDIMVKIIVQNIKEDISIEMISKIANDILRKEEGMSDIEIAYFRGQSSGLEYLIKAESRNIISTVKDLFSNSNPMSEDLNLEVIKSSDINARDVVKKMGFSGGSDSGPQELLLTGSRFEAQVNSFNTQTGIDFVHDARFTNNIYTMNYHHGHKHNTPFYNTQGGNSGPTISTEWRDSELFGFFPFKGTKTEEGRVISTDNKNFFHSLPMSHRSSVDIDTYYVGEIKTNHTPGAYSLDWKVGLNAKQHVAKYDAYRAYADTDFFNSGGEFDEEYRDFTRLNFARLTQAHNANAFSKENILENTFGTELHKELGNFIIQPYIKIVDTTPEERQNMTVSVLTKIDGSDVDPTTGEPCDPEYSLSDPISASEFEGVFQEINGKRKEEGNIFKCHIFDYVPLTAWSHFYSSIFLKTIFNHYSPAHPGVQSPLFELYKKYGFKLMFKELKIGLRLTYAIPAETLDQFHSAFPEENIRNVMFDAFRGEQEIEGLKRSKSLYVQRPYYIYNDQNKEQAKIIMSEIHVPVVEVERSLNVVEGSYSFVLDDSSDLINLDELGFWAYAGSSGYGNSEYKNPDYYSLANLSEEKLKYMANSASSFFYKNLAPGLVQELKNSAEFKLIFDHCIPMRKYMVMGFMYAADGLSKFIPEPTDVLDLTKKKLMMIMENLINSQDYKYVPNDVLNSLGDAMLRNAGGTTGKDTDIYPLILKMIYKTMFMILKGFVEITDPAVIIAKLIIDIANAITMATLGAIESGLNATKLVLNGSKIMAESALTQALMQVKMAGSMLIVTKDTLNFPAEADGCKPLKTYITIQMDGEDPETWEMKVDDVPQDCLDKLDEDQKNTFEGFTREFNRVFAKDNQDSLISVYISAKQELDEITEELEGIVKDLEEFHEEAKETMEDVFSSPYLLPGLWAALLPSMMPLGGGIIPPPFYLGPPSTVPGMIYLALLLIDAIEDKQHRDLNPDDCDDQL
tara:strand:- start:40012 stop:49734 length:9723 start_codon:yes stop_codon:yes gene_type:complete